MFGLNFLSPLFLIGALAVAIPLALHLFRRRTETVIDFPGVRLMRQSPIEQQKRRRLRELLLLALRVAALLLLAFAFARPYFGAGTSGIDAPITLVAVDTSMSMGAPGQWERAREAAKNAVANASATDLVGLIAFADSATVVVPPAGDRGSILAAIDGLTPGGGGTRYHGALARAAEVIGPRPGRIVVVTDLQHAGWEATAQGGVRDGIAVEVRAVPSPEGNLAVTLAQREGPDMVATVHNFGMRSARTSARLEVQGKTADARQLDVPPQSSLQVRFTTALPASGAATVSIDDATGYQADNSRFVVLDPPAPVPIAIVTGSPAAEREGLYLERALGVGGRDASFKVAAVDGRVFSAWPRERVREQALIALVGTATLQREGRDAIRGHLEEGGQVFLVLGPGIDLATLADTIGVDLGAGQEPTAVPGATATLVATDVRHPIFRPFLGPTGALGDVYVGSYRRLKDEQGEVLARFTGGAAALIERPVGRGRLLIFTSDLDNEWNRFPLNPAFVPFSLETARYLTRGREERQAWTLPDRPDGFRDTPGVFTVRTGGEERRAAVNVDPRESNPSAGTMDQFVANVPRVSGGEAEPARVEAAGQEERQRLWQVGLLLMLLALAGEGFVGRKAI